MTTTVSKKDNYYLCDFFSYLKTIFYFFQDVEERQRRLDIAKVAMDEEAARCGLSSFEELLLARLVDEIGGTQEQGNKVLEFIHFCHKLNGRCNVNDKTVEKNQQCCWISRLPRRYTTIKRHIQSKLNKINSESDMRTGKHARCLYS